MRFGAGGTSIGTSSRDVQTAELPLKECVKAYGVETEYPPGIVDIVGNKNGFGARIACDFEVNEAVALTVIGNWKSCG